MYLSLVQFHSHPSQISPPETSTNRPPLRFCCSLEACLYQKPSSDHLTKRLLSMVPIATSLPLSEASLRLLLSKEASSGASFPEKLPSGDSSVRTPPPLPPFLGSLPPTTAPVGRLPPMSPFLRNFPPAVPLVRNCVLRSRFPATPLLGSRPTMTPLVRSLPADAFVQQMSSVNISCRQCL